MKGFGGRLFGGIAAGAIAGMTATVPAVAGELVHQFTNPSFGGNPFNSSHLLGIANAQNDYTDPSARSSSSATAGLSQGELFARQLESRLLSGLASQVTDAIFGPNPQDSGTVQFGEQTITFVRGLESIVLTIFDDRTGESTQIQVPTLTP